MDWSHALRLIAAEQTLSIAGLVLLLVAAWAGDKASRAISIASVAVLVGAMALVAPALCAGAAGPSTEVFYGQFRADAFASFAKLLIYGSAALALIVAPAFFERFRAMRAEYPVLILLAALGTGMMVSATDFLTLYIGLEMNSLASYVLAAFLRSDDRSAEAGLKYFVLGALASGILLFGISLTYGFTGTTQFAAISAAMHGGLTLGMIVGIVFVLAGIGFKIAAVPFHMWTPDVYEGAPTPVTLFFATAPKVGAMAMLMRVALDAFGGGGAQVFRARRAGQRHPAVRRQPDLRLHRPHRVRRHPRRHGWRADHRHGLRDRLRHGRHRLQGRRGAIPHVDAGRL